MNEFQLTLEILQKLISSLEPSYQEVQKETKSRNRKRVPVPRTVQEKYIDYTPIDGAYFGIEQIIEKLQADLKIFTNLQFGNEGLYKALFPNLDSTVADSATDKHEICRHYMHSMLRWFFLDISNLLEACIRDLCELKKIQPSSNIDSLVKKMKSLKIEEEKLEQIRDILTQSEEAHTSLPRFLDRIVTTKAETEFRKFTDILITIRNASHNGFYYGTHLKRKGPLSAFGRSYEFSPGRVIDVSIHHVAYFLDNSVALIKALDAEFFHDKEQRIK